MLCESRVYWLNRATPLDSLVPGMQMCLLNETHSKCVEGSRKCAGKGRSGDGETKAPMDMEERARASRVSRGVVEIAQ